MEEIKNHEAIKGAPNMTSKGPSSTTLVKMQGKSVWIIKLSVTVTKFNERRMPTDEAKAERNMIRI